MSVDEAASKYPDPAFLIMALRKQIKRPCMKSLWSIWFSLGSDIIAVTQLSLGQSYLVNALCVNMLCFESACVISP